MLKNKLKKENSLTKPQNEYEGRVGLVYARVSSKRQETEGSGLESQDGRCINDLRILGVPYIKTFPDSFTGGGDFMKRPAMREILKYIDDHPDKKFVVVFDDLKRFARDVEFHLKLRTAFRMRDVTLRCLNYNFDESPEGRFAEIVMAGSAELERHQNQRQVIQKQKARLEKGYWAFGSKRGYKQTKDPIHGTISIPTKDGLEILKPAIEKFATGELQRKIDVCRHLVEKGFWKKQSPEKYLDRIDAILKDPFYAGDIQFLDWEVARRKGHHEGIISYETYDLVQKRLKNDGLNKRIRVDVSDVFPLRGLITCASCGGHLTGALAKKKFPYYFCYNKTCEFYKKSIREGDAEKRFIALLKKTHLKADTDKILQVVFDRTWKDEIRTLEASKSLIASQISKIEEKLGQLSDASIKATSEAVKRTYESQIEKTSQELELLQEQTSLSEIDLSIPYRTALSKAKGLLKSPYTVWKKLGTHEQQQLFFFIYEAKLPYHKIEGYRTDKIRSYVGLFEGFATANSSDVEMPGIEPGCNQDASNESTAVARFLLS